MKNHTCGGYCAECDKELWEASSDEDKAFFLALGNFIDDNDEYMSDIIDKGRRCKLFSKYSADLNHLWHQIIVTHEIIALEIGSSGK